MAATPQAKVGHFLAKILGIKLEDPEPIIDEVTRGESVFSVQTTETFVESQPTTMDFIRDMAPDGKDVAQYFRSLFPFLQWIGHYNLLWLAGDLVAGTSFRQALVCLEALASNRDIGITIGAVVVPQGMAYAQLANLPVEYGLYSSFMGVLIYWFFATSKDITIGVS
jgi:solute carrier family 26 (sodium-independent sulfate anion transporter), member 11